MLSDDFGNGSDNKHYNVMYSVWISEIVKDQSPIQSAFSESLMERAIAMVRTMGRRHHDEKLLPHRAHSLEALPSQLFVSTKLSMYTIQCLTTLKNYVRIQVAKKEEKF
ncbi:hypothetical protein BOTCAL_0329g00160 [Botryotinia calthae]|uniref:Uncharacterized protein n=1 Tax=Botryotinia calthae TaxID=38488 RepID=A0A4Y8CW05_9HELO|nr:hypothetical protein BOTCAL_0329g00160 [Botryotinia calthae]